MLLGVSKAVLEYVIFCHQEDQLWPFSDSNQLKKIFDELFDTSQFTQMIQQLQKQFKENKKKLKDIELKYRVCEKEYEYLQNGKYELVQSCLKIQELKKGVEEKERLLKKC